MFQQTQAQPGAGYAPTVEPTAAEPSLQPLQPAPSLPLAEEPAARPTSIEELNRQALEAPSIDTGLRLPEISMPTPEQIAQIEPYTGALGPAVRGAGTLAEAILPPVGRALEEPVKAVVESPPGQAVGEFFERTGGVSEERPSGGEWAGPVTGAAREEQGRQQQIREAEVEAGMSFQAYQDIFNRYTRGETELEPEVRRVGSIFQRHTVLNPEDPYAAYGRAPADVKNVTEGAATVASTGVGAVLLPGGVARTAPGIARAIASGLVDPMGIPFVAGGEALAGAARLGGKLPTAPPMMGVRARDADEGIRNTFNTDVMPWRSWPTSELHEPPRTWYGDPELSQREIEQIAVNSGFHRTTPEEFEATIKRVAAMPDPERPGKLVGDSLSTFDLAEYANMKTFLAKDGGWGYAVRTTPEGNNELVSVFRAPDAPKGAGVNATAHAVATQGVTHLDAYDDAGRLPKLYSKFGFREVARDAWNPQFAAGARGMYRDDAGKWVSPDFVSMQRGTPAAAAARQAEEERLLRLASREVAAGREAPAGARITTEAVSIPRRGKRAERAGEGVGIPGFRTSEGDVVPLRSPTTKGLMGSAGSRVFGEAISRRGGRKSFPVGRFKRADGSEVPYDSPQEVIFMSDLERAKGEGEIQDWWRSEDSPISELADLKYVNTHPDKFGYGTYKGDFVIRHADDSLELRESKPEKVIRTQEEWGRSRAKGWTGELGWHVLKKAIGVIPALAEAGAKYTIVPESEAGKLLKMAPGETTYSTPLPATLPSGKLRGKAAKTVVGMPPGIDYRDVPEIMTHLPGGTGNLPGHEVISIVNRTSEKALAMAQAGATRNEIVRFVRDSLLPTADIVKREHGPTRMWTGAQMAIGEARGVQPLSIPEAKGMLEQWPDAAKVLDTAKARGVQIDGLAINPETGGALVTASGDPAGIEAIAAELAQATQSTRGAVMYADNGPAGTQWARPVIIDMPTPQADEALEAISAQLGEKAFISYNESGSGILNVLGVSAADAHNLAKRARKSLSEAGVESTLAKPVQVAVSDLSEEGYATAIARRRELLGETPYQGAYGALDAGRTRGGGAGVGPGGAAAPGGVAPAGPGADLPLRPPGAAGAGAPRGRPRLRHADEGGTGAAPASALLALPPLPPGGGAATEFAGRAATGAVAGGVAAAREEGATPESVLRGGLQGGLLAGGRTALQRAGLRAPARTAARIVAAGGDELAAAEPAVERAAPTMGGGTIGISQSPTFLRESLRRMYPGAINKAAAKEAVQNSVDASRGIPGATTTVSVDNQARTISIVDQGKGMSPQTMEDVFVKLGGSQKPAGAAGGMGTAIKAIMANAEDTWVRTIGRDPGYRCQFTDSVMHGSGDDFLNGTMHRYYAPLGEMPVLGADWRAARDLDLDYAEQDTGTAIWTKPLADVDWTPYTLNSWITQFNKTNRIPDQTVEFVVDGNLIGSNQKRRLGRQAATHC